MKIWQVTAEGYGPVWYSGTHAKRRAYLRARTLKRAYRKLTPRVSSYEANTLPEGCLTEGGR